MGARVHLEQMRPLSLDVSRPADARRGGEIRSRDLAPHWSWLILGCVTLLYVATCFTPVIFDDNEGLYAGSVREMHQRGDWLVPMSNGFPRVQKPPLVYWTMLVSTSLLGENEFALRLPNALSTAGWIIATYLIARRLGGERFGIASALVLASMLGVWVFNHLVQPEPFLACFLSHALWCLVEARTGLPPRTRGGWHVWFWVFLALGTMSKGLHGALWPLGVVGLTALLVPGWRPWLRPVFNLRGPLLFAVIVVPWYAYMAAHFPGFLRAHFINEQLGASLNTRFPVDAEQLSVWQFYGQHLLFWLPWTLLVPAAIYAVLRKDRPGLSDATRDVVKLLAVFFGLVMVTVGFSARQDYYAMSCWGAMAILLALPWVSATGNTAQRWLLGVPCLLVALAGTCSLACAGYLQAHLSVLGSGTASPIQDRDTFMHALAGISPALWGHFLTLLGMFGAAALLAGLVALALVWRDRAFSALLVLAGAMAVPICLAAAGFTMMSPYFSLADDARFLNGKLARQPNAEVVCDALPNTASSLFYYLNARVHWVNAPFDNQYAQQVLGLGRDFYLDESALENLWHSGAPVYLIIEQDRLSYWQSHLLPAPQVEHQSGTRLVICNR